MTNGTEKWNALIGYLIFSDLIWFKCQDITIPSDLPPLLLRFVCFCDLSGLLQKLNCIENGLQSIISQPFVYLACGTDSWKKIK